MRAGAASVFALVAAPEAGHTSPPMKASVVEALGGRQVVEAEVGHPIQIVDDMGSGKSRSGTLTNTARTGPPMKRSVVEALGGEKVVEQEVGHPIKIIEGQ